MVWRDEKRVVVVKEKNVVEVEEVVVVDVEEVVLGEEEALLESLFSLVLQAAWEGKHLLVVRKFGCIG